MRSHEGIQPACNWYLSSFLHTPGAKSSEYPAYPMLMRDASHRGRNHVQNLQIVRFPLENYTGVGT